MDVEEEEEDDEEEKKRRDRHRRLREKSVQLEDQEIFYSPFVQTHRSESNFLKRNDDPTIKYPTKYTAEYNLLDRSPLSVLRHTYESFIEQEQLRRSFFNSVGLASLSTFFASFLTLTFKFEDDLEVSCDDVDGKFSIKNIVQGSSEALSAALDGYKFLPLFLLLAYTAFLVERWRSFLVTCHTIQGSIHDIGKKTFQSTNQANSFSFSHTADYFVFFTAFQLLYSFC